jgi:hypothetical protein
MNGTRHSSKANLNFRQFCNNAAMRIEEPDLLKDSKLKPQLTHTPRGGIANFVINTMPGDDGLYYGANRLSVLRQNEEQPHFLRLYIDTSSLNTMKS